MRIVTDILLTMIYQIRVREELAPHWSEWFEGMTITPGESGDTLIRGPIVDQAALYGILRKVRDLGLTLYSVNLDQGEDI